MLLATVTIFMPSIVLHFFFSPRLGAAVLLGLPIENLIAMVPPQEEAAKSVSLNQESS